MICSIVRDRIDSLPTWWKQIKSLIDFNPEMEFEVSVYENDSIDGSDAWLHDIVEFEDSSVPFHLSTERLRTAYFGSIVSGERVENLAFARNQCFLPVNLDTFDKVVFIEPDVVYNIEEMTELLLADHDICSGFTLCQRNGQFYDTWATRLKEGDEWWHNTRGFVNQPTSVISTFNGFCVYRAEVIAQGHTFSGFSQQLQKHDCDTAVICENFRAAGFSDIVLYPYTILHP